MGSLTETDKALELAFETKILRTICENEATAFCEFGPAVAEVLKRRLADLRASTSVNDLLVGNPRIPDGADPQHMVIDLIDGYRMIFCANHPNNPVTQCGKLIWTKVSRIKILRIDSDNE